MKLEKRKNFLRLLSSEEMGSLIYLSSTRDSDPETLISVEHFLRSSLLHQLSFASVFLSNCRSEAMLHPDAYKMYKNYACPTDWSQGERIELNEVERSVEVELEVSRAS